MAIASRVQLARESAPALLQLLSLALCVRRSLPHNPRDMNIVLGQTGESGIKIASNEK